MDELTTTSHLPVEPAVGNQFYQAYDVAEDVERTAYHYQQDPEFFCTVTGGDWHVYSCLLWEEDFTITQAQEKKLDKLAEMMGLQPGMHILEVGFGWGGPLVYLGRKYGVTGHGITIAPRQIPMAEERAAQYGVQATFEVIHWKELPEHEQYDAIFSDEVITHFNDLDGFFAKCHKLLKPGGRMAHKELHLTHPRYGELGPLSQHANKVFGYTGNYLPLAQELKLLNDNGFQISHHFQIPIEHYQRTMDAWLKNSFDNRERLKAITSPDFYKDYRAFLKGVRYIFTRGDYLTVDIVASHKMSDW